MRQRTSRSFIGGLDPQLARAFFRGQIQASKVAQTALHAEWTRRRQPPFARVVDLANHIRPVLDQLTARMMDALAEALPILQGTGGRRLVVMRSKRILVPDTGVNEAAREAIAPLLKLEER
jgi:hypothetical protein